MSENGFKEVDARSIAPRLESAAAERLLADSRGDYGAAKSDNVVSNPFAAFANGLVHSVERSYNGVAQVATNNNYTEANVAKVADTSSKLAQGAYIAGDLLGTGAQMLTIYRFLPKSQSLMGSFAKGGGTGAIYGGIMQPSEGADLGSERIKSGLSMAAFMSTFEAGRVGMYATGLYKQSLLQSALRGSAAGGLAGASHEAVDKALNGEPVTMSGLGIASAKGAALGATMELTSAALARTDFKNLGSGTNQTKPAPRDRSEQVQLDVASSAPFKPLRSEAELLAPTGPARAQ